MSSLHPKSPTRGVLEGRPNYHTKKKNQIPESGLCLQNNNGGGEREFQGDPLQRATLQCRPTTSPAMAEAGDRVRGVRHGRGPAGRRSTWSQGPGGGPGRAELVREFGLWLKHGVSRNEVGFAGFAMAFKNKR